MVPDDRLPGRMGRTIALSPGKRRAIHSFADASREPPSGKPLPWIASEIERSAWESWDA